MASYVKFELEDGTVVYIETTEVAKGASGLIPPTRGFEAVEQAEHSFEKSIEGVRKMATVMMEQFRAGFVEKPSEVAISFGLKASAELGNLVVARGGLEANYNVSLRWNSDKDKEKDKDQQDEEKAA